MTGCGGTYASAFLEILMPARLCNVALSTAGSRPLNERKVVVIRQFRQSDFRNPEGLFGLGHGTFEIKLQSCDARRQAQQG
ncbi:hypothetical protein D3C77_726890 [compost metagenome]